MKHIDINKRRLRYGGFTLIELSIVLVIIGLVVGGVLVGRDLISAAQVRAQISQIEKYNQSVNTFKVKYNYLPGDMPDPDASNFGFQARGTAAGQGDGDGMIAGSIFGYKYSGVQAGEPLMLWVDLAKSGLIDGGFTTASSSVYPSSDVTGNSISSYYPEAKLGNGLYIYTNGVYTNDPSWTNTSYPPFRGKNFFSVSKITAIAFATNNRSAVGAQGITVNKAYAMDTKIDDGFPISGRVVAAASIGLSSGNMMWANADINAGQVAIPPGNTAIAPSSTTCYDNSSNATNAVQYSITQNSGNGVNCVLSFQFQ